MQTSSTSDPVKYVHRSMKWQASPMMRPPPAFKSCTHTSGGMYPAFMVATMFIGAGDKCFLSSKANGANRRLNPTVTQPFEFSKASSTRFNPFHVVESGFSTKTCLWLSKASATNMAWLPCWVVTKTVLTSWSARRALVVCCAVLNGVLGRLNASAQAFRAGDGFDLGSGFVQFGQDGGPCEVACANDTKHRFAWIGSSARSCGPSGRPPGPS